MLLELPFLHLKVPATQSVRIANLDKILELIIGTFGQGASAHAFPAQANPSSFSHADAYGVYIEYDDEAPQWTVVNRLCAELSAIAGYRIDVVLRAKSRQERSSLGKVLQACGVDLNWPEHKNHRAARMVCMMEYPILMREITIAAHRKLLDTQKLFSDYSIDQTESIRTGLVFNMKRLAQHIGGPLARCALLVEGIPPTGAWQADVVECEARGLFSSDNSTLQTLYDIQEIDYDGNCNEVLHPEDVKLLIARLDRALNPRKS